MVQYSYNGIFTTAKFDPLGFTARCSRHITVRVKVTKTKTDARRDNGKKKLLYTVSGDATKYVRN